MIFILVSRLIYYNFKYIKLLKKIKNEILNLFTNSQINQEYSYVAVVVFDSSIIFYFISLYIYNNNDNNICGANQLSTAMSLFPVFKMNYKSHMSYDNNKKRYNLINLNSW